MITPESGQPNMANTSHDNARGQWGADMTQTRRPQAVHLQPQAAVSLTLSSVSNSELNLQDDSLLPTFPRHNKDSLPDMRSSQYDE